VSAPTRFLFFTGKGGVGKTSLSTATAITLADAGLRVLLVSTDAASNIDEMLGVPLSNQPVAVPGVPGLSVLNIDPDAAAEAYRQRVLAQLDAGASDTERATVREQLSGACTTEIAAFDEFAALLASEGHGHDHVIFDTAPTGHTLRLLSLPKAWTGFLAGNDRGASCLGPHSGLKMQEARFAAALRALSDPALTTVVLVTRPDPRPMQEAWATSAWRSTACFMPAGPATPLPTPSKPWAARPCAKCPMRWPACRATKCRCARSTPWAWPPCARCWGPRRHRCPARRPPCMPPCLPNP
jgi:arsenite-transporting ATPase